jgi:AraC-like DNA-binding protein
MSNVEWLLRSATDTRTLPMGERTVFDDARWRASIERIEIGGGLRVFLTDVRAHQDVTVEAPDNRTDQWMGGHVTLAGRAEVDFLDGSRSATTASRALLFRTPGRRAAYSLKAGPAYRSAGYGLEIGRIVRLFDGEVPRPLQPLLMPMLEASRLLAVRSDRLMRRLAASLFAPGFNGPLRALMLEGAVIQLIAAQAAAAGRKSLPQPRTILARGERDAVHAAHQRLLADMRDPPSLGELAAAVGLSERRLSAAFRSLFGATPFETLRNHRLEQARLVLQSGEGSLKEVSFRVGYNHISNFTAAFARRFGEPPRRYLRRRDQAAD